MSYIYRIESVFVPASPGIADSNSEGQILTRRIMHVFSAETKQGGAVLRVLTEQANGGAAAGQ